MNWGLLIVKFNHKDEGITFQGIRSGLIWFGVAVGKLELGFVTRKG